MERIHIYRPLELASELIKSADVHSRTRGIDLFDFPFICALTTRKISRRRQKLAPPIQHINPNQSSATRKYLIMIIKAHFQLAHPFRVVLLSPSCYRNSEVIQQDILKKNSFVAWTCSDGSTERIIEMVESEVGRVQLSSILFNSLLILLI